MSQPSNDQHENGQVFTVSLILLIGCVCLGIATAEISGKGFFIGLITAVGLFTFTIGASAVKQIYRLDHQESLIKQLKAIAERLPPPPPKA
jgi:hypothetical protein